MYKILFIALSLFSLSACAGQPKIITADSGEGVSLSSLDEAMPARTQAPAYTPSLPSQELTGKIIYQLLLAEIAVQRGRLNVAMATYLDVAKSTKDPRVAQRATEIAIYARQPHQRNLAPGVSEAVGFERAVEVLQNLAPTLAECQVTLALEPLGPEEGNFLLTAASAIELARAVDSPFVKLHLDVKAMSTESSTIPEIIRSSRDWLVHFHANDPNRCGPGMGDVDFEPIVAVLDEIGYRGWVSVEVFDYARGIESLAGESIRYLQQLANR